MSSTVDQRSNGAVVEWPLPVAGDVAAVLPSLVRDGQSLLERAALARLGRTLASLPPASLVRVILWPETVNELATKEGIQPAQLYNLLSGHRPYHAVRKRLARRLGLVVADLDVIDLARRPIAEAGIPAGIEPVAMRDGQSTLERLVFDRARENMGAFPPGMVLQLLLWPFTEAELAAEIGVGTQDLYNMLTFAGRRYEEVRKRVCGFLGIERQWLDHLVETPRAEPVPLEVQV